MDKPNIRISKLWVNRKTPESKPYLNGTIEIASLLKLLSTLTYDGYTHMTVKGWRTDQKELWENGAPVRDENGKTKTVPLTQFDKYLNKEVPAVYYNLVFDEDSTVKTGKQEK